MPTQAKSTPEPQDPHAVPHDLRTSNLYPLTTRNAQYRDVFVTHSRSTR